MIFLIGPPGAGKGTQAQILVERYSMVTFSVGAIFRDSHDSDILAYTQKGELVPAPAAIRAVLAATDKVPADKTVIIDGFPRNLEQARASVKALEAHARNLDAVIHLVVSEEVSAKRLALRGRQDDSPAILKHRWDIYRDETLPVVAYYEQLGLLRQVDGEGDIEEVAQRTQKALGL